MTTLGHSPTKADLGCDVGSLSWVTAHSAWPSALGEIQNPEALLVCWGTGAEHAWLHHNPDRWVYPARHTDRLAVVSLEGACVAAV